MKIKFVLLLLISLLVTGSTTSAQSWVWGQQSKVSGVKAIASPGNIATNRTGNLYQTGGFGPSVITFGTTSLVTKSYVSAEYLVKYDSTGNFLWARQDISNYNNTSWGVGVISDDSDNSYVTGEAYNWFGQPDTAVFGPDTLYTPAYGGELFLVKYNANGKVIWARQPSYDISPGYGWGLTMDNFGHEYVSGFYASLIKFDRNGNIIWSLRQAGADQADDLGYSVTTDYAGNVYMAGAFYDSLELGTYHLRTQNGGIFIAKFDSNGNVIWAQQSNNNNFYLDGNSVSVATDMSGAVYLTSYFLDTISFGSHTFTTSPYSFGSFYVVKYNPDGNIDWGKEATALNFNQAVGWSSYTICTDNFNNIYISGGEDYGSTNQSASLVFGKDTINFMDTDSHSPPSFLLKLDISGNVICGSTLATGGLEYNAVTSDPFGKYVYIGGNFLDSLVFGKDTLIDDSTGDNDSYVGRWQSCKRCNLVISSPTQSLTICKGQTVKLTASGGTNYYWSPIYGLNTQFGDTVFASPITNVIYTVFISDSAGCTGQAFDTLNIIPAPNKPIITISVTGDSLISSANSYNQWYFNGVLIPDSTRQVLVIKGHSKGWYSVTVTNPANGCSTNSDSTTSVNRLSIISEQLSIYPNPFNSNLTIIISPSVTEVKDWSLQLTDVLGQQLYSMPFLNYSNEIDLSKLDDGIYFIKVSSARGTVTKAIVKQH